jgi:hypothetical protein
MKSLLTCLVLLGATAVYAQDETTKQTEKDSVAIKNDLNEVVVEKKKQAVERKADRTVFDFSEQAYL